MIALISRIMLLFVGLALAGITTFIYFFIAAAVTSLLGIQNDTLSFILYIVCLAAGWATGIYFVCRLWSKAEHPKRPPDEY